MPKEKHSKRKHHSHRRDKDDHDEKTRHKHSHKQKKKYKKRRESSSSSATESVSASPSSSSASSVKLIKVLEERRIQERLERKKLRDELKAKETPEEKRARRLREKQMKELKRRERMGWDTEYQNYTNQDNPFGDSNLTSTFVWNKKLEKEGLKDVSIETMEILSRQKQLENKVELEKVKKRRLDRELERQAREEEMILQQRSKEAAQFQEWERQEDQFHLEQARLRSIIRIQDGRAKPIDLLAQYISSTKLDDSIEMQMHEPYMMLSGLGIKDLEDLLTDIKVYVALDKNSNTEFWDDMTVIVEDELHKLQKSKAEGDLNASVGGRREGIHTSVVRDVSEIFRGKSTAELDQLRGRIESKIKARSDGVDISYWESLLYQLKAHMARARLRDRHQQNLREKLIMLKTESSKTSDNEQASTSNAVERAAHFEENSAVSETSAASAEEYEDENDMLEVCFRMYDDGSYSPKYLSQAEIDPQSLIIDEEENQKRIHHQRSRFVENDDEDKQLSSEEFQMRCEARKGMLADEAEFSVESPLDAPLQLASDKYRPRKPRYFNRVHTGFEWNKYNQTHYDMDNPPPKIVQGYKFNIFYPDLIDKSTTPQYFLTPCPDNADFAILRFHAGPPYEDIAFKIVNREWEFSYKRGFRCQFHNNIFQLWFHFKRYRYRR